MKLIHYNFFHRCPSIGGRANLAAEYAWISPSATTPSIDVAKIGLLKGSICVWIGPTLWPKLFGSAETWNGPKWGGNWAGGRNVAHQIEQKKGSSIFGWGKQRAAEEKKKKVGLVGENLLKKLHVCLFMLPLILGNQLICGISTCSFQRKPISLEKVITKQIYG